MNSILILLLLLELLHSTDWCSYGQQGKEEKELVDHRPPHSGNLTAEAEVLPNFYIVLPENMPDFESNPTSPTVRHLNRSENDLSIYLLTYNVARESPSEDLLDMFDFQRVGVHDIYVVALEELSFLSMITWDPFMSQFDDIFRARGYVRLERVRFMITSLSIYVPKNKLSKFHNVNSDSVTTDLGLRKGGIGIRLFFENLSLAFVGAHLAAHEGHYETRIKNYREIIDGIRFSNGPKDGILDQDYSFFIGDLNWRINDLTSQQVYDAILLADNPRVTDPEKWEPLLQHDQLRFAQQTKQAFQHFLETNITFPPTYRFIISTDNYDWQKRKPAYTDRILYRNTLSNRVQRAGRDRVALQVVHYDSLRQYRGSDHKPVRAIAHIPETAFEEKHKWLQTRRVVKRSDVAGATSNALKSSTASSGTGRSLDVNNEVVADTPPGSTQRHWTFHFEDPSTSLARHMTVQFDSVRNWTLENNHTIYFRVIDKRNNQPVGADFPGLFQVFSHWDWIGLYREDFYSLDNYVTFTYPRFGETIEVAEDALALLPDTDIEDQLSTSQASTSEAASTSTPSTSSAAYLSSNEFGDGHSYVAAQGSGVAPPVPTPKATKNDDEKSRSSSSSLHSSLSSTKTSSSYVSYEEAEPQKEPVAVSGSGDQTDSDVSRSSSASSSFSSPTSATASSHPAASTTTTSSRQSEPSHEFSAMFDEQSFLFSAGRYVLIYRRQNGDVLGMSTPFEIRAEPEEEQPPPENTSN